MAGTKQLPVTEYISLLAPQELGVHFYLRHNPLLHIKFSNSLLLYVYPNYLTEGCVV